jgi:hypothetical protein
MVLSLRPDPAARIGRNPTLTAARRQSVQQAIKSCARILLRLLRAVVGTREKSSPLRGIGPVSEGLLPQR